MLHAVFTERGFTIEENVAFAEGGVSCDLDGWDAAARVGYEYRCHAERDHDDLDDTELAVLATRMERGELFILIIDDDDIADADELRGYAEAFLNEVSRRRGRSS